MSYTPTEWSNGDVITAEKLNKIENGIVNSNNIFMVNINKSLDWSTNPPGVTYTPDKTFAETLEAYQNGDLIIFHIIQEEYFLIAHLYNGGQCFEAKIINLGVNNNNIDSIYQTIYLFVSDDSIEDYTSSVTLNNIVTN